MNGIIGAFNFTEQQAKYIEGYNITESYICLRNEKSIIKLFYPHGREAKARIFDNTNGSLDVIVFGDVFLGNDNISSEPKKIIDKQIRKDLNGEFIIIILDKNTDSIEIFIDQNYATPLYYASYAKSFVFSSYMSAVHKLVGSPKVIYAKAIHDFLAYGNCLGSDTFFKDIKRLHSPDGIVCASNNVRIYRYGEVREEYCENVRQAKDEVMHSLISAIKKRLTSKRIAVSMSGGMDSRFMLGLLTKYFKGLDICGYMWSQPDSHELEIARKVCTAAGVELKPIILSPEDFIKDYKECCEYHGGNDYIFQSFAIRTGKTLANDADLVFTGFCMDLSLGCTFSDEEMLQANSITDDMLQKKRAAIKAEVFSQEEIENATKPNIDFKAYSRDLYDEFSKFCRKQNFRRVQDFVFINRVQNLVINRDFVPRQFVEYAYPNVDLDFIRTVNRIPYNIKNGHRFYRELFIEEFSELSKIEYFNTGLPVAAPVEYWAKGKAIEAQREKLYSELFYNTDKSIEYSRYYSNYDQWLSGNEYWKSVFKSTIYSDNSVMYKTVFDKEYIRKIFEDHINGRANNRKKLVSAITLQGIMQYYGIESVE